MSLSKLQELVMDREDWRAAVNGVAELDSAERQNWPWDNMVLHPSRERGVSALHFLKPSSHLMLPVTHITVNDIGDQVIESLEWVETEG